MKKQLFIFLSVFFFAFRSQGQTRIEQFNGLMSAFDTLNAKHFLERWEKEDQSDPELCVAYFNFFVIKSKKEVIRLDNKSNGQDGFMLMNQDSTQKDPVAFMYGDTYYEPKILVKGFDWIDRGIELYPNRLDMRFGKIYILGQTGDYQNFAKEIIKTIDYAAKNQNQWIWSENKPVEDPKSFMLGSIQSYQAQLFNTNDDGLLDEMQLIAETVLKYYPDQVESLSNLAVTFMLKGQYQDALAPLLKAEQINPKDYIVLNNIAQAYSGMGNKEKAIAYYKLTIKYGDKEIRKFANEQIDLLKKQ